MSSRATPPANFLFDRMEQERLLLLTGDTEYTRGILPEFLKQYEESLGGEIVASIAVDEDGWQQRAADAIERQRDWCGLHRRLCRRDPRGRDVPPRERVSREGS